MMSGVVRYLMMTSLLGGFVGALGLCAAQSSAHAQTSAHALKAPAVTKPEPAPKILTGTLFNSREQREQLDQARLRGGVPENEGTATVEPDRPVINGFVKRSDGRNTVWVDDVMKRDPRSEMVEQLEPNLVGGGNISTKLVQSGSTAPAQLTPTGKFKELAARRSRELARSDKRRSAAKLKY